jgi:AraC family L-rhamnose operon transcriptional activator RhaR
MKRIRRIVRKNSPATRRAATRAAPREPFGELSLLPIVVRLGSYRADFLYWGHFPRRPWRNYLHTHSFFEICYAYHGAGTFRIAGAEHDVAAGDLFIARPNEPHEIVSSRAKPLGIYFWAYTLAPSNTPATTNNGATDAKPTDGLLETFAGSKRVVARRSGVEPTLRLLSDEVGRRRPGYVQAIESLATKLLLDTARDAVGASAPAEPIEPPARSPAEAVTRTAIRYLRDNFSRPIEVRDVAAQVHLSERHLSRLFLQATGSSLVDYLTKIRMDAAAQLLLDNDVPIKQVAMRVGYPDVHYFTTLFGRRTGLTPAAFRAARGTKFLSRKPKS